MEKHTVNIYPSGKEGEVSELVIREGLALPLQEPTPIYIRGVLNAPYQFFSQKMENYNPLSCHVLINKAINRITFIGNDRDEYKDTVEGSLIFSSELEAFCINQDKKWSISEFRTFLRTVKFFFASPEEHTVLLESMQKFSMNVSKTFENHNNNTGNSKYLIETAVNGIPFKNSFMLNIPIFKGYAKEKFAVEIGIDPTSTDVKLFLISDSIYEIIEKKKEKYIQEAVEIFKSFGCSIIEIV